LAVIQQILRYKPQSTTEKISNRVRNFKQQETSWTHSISDIAQVQPLNLVKRTNIR